ncbi:hypothetical protein LCGC14_0846980 [marine sediment metagenome]|uniref:Uncharacterized protein n=1 Tax=marine sediment metagenome TaxID=412755 RepID=A0A0F9SIG9_9ZZZZ
MKMAVFSGLADVQGYGEYEDREVIIHSGPWLTTRQSYDEGGLRESMCHPPPVTETHYWWSRWQYSMNVNHWLSEHVPNGKQVKVTIKVEVLP